MLEIAPHLIESTLLVLGVFLVGCVLGYGARRTVARSRTRQGTGENKSIKKG